jgi:hypothetical protein
LAESKVRLAHFQSIIETQNSALEELRGEVRNLRSRQNVLSDKVSDSKAADKGAADVVQGSIL